MKAAKSDPSAVAVFIPSCDAYSDLWVPFFTLFWRHWPDCPFKVYLGSNSLKFAHSRVVTLKSDKGVRWADRCLDHLAQIPEPYVLLWLEDFFLRGPVNSKEVVRIYGEFCDRAAHLFRLVRRPGPKNSLPNCYYGALSVGDDYRVSTQAAFWRKESLEKLIVVGETIWEFELKGTRRSAVFPDGFYGVTRDIIPYRHHVVERGKWFPWEAWHFGRQKIGCDFSRRPIMTYLEASRWLSTKAISLALAAMPVTLREATICMVRRLKRHAK